jgi:hypothetical protein
MEERAGSAGRLRQDATHVTLNAVAGQSTTDTPFARNFACELELPRMEKRLPTAALTLTQV